MKKVILITFALLLPVSVRADIDIKDAYVPAMPPGSMVFAAYFTISNTGTEPRELLGVESSSFKGAHLHHTKMKDGVSSMMSMDSIVIEPGETLTLKPGGTHVMLMKPDKGSIKNSSVPLVLVFKSGERKEISAPIKALN